MGFTLRRINTTIALLSFLAITVVPLYSQEVKSSQQLPGADAAAKSEPQVSRQVTAKPPSSQKFTFPTRGERFNRYVKSTVGPSSFVGSALKAGIDQWADNPEEWEQGASGYGRRFASDFGRNAIQQTVVYGLDSALGLDIKFRRSTRKSFFPRMTDALAENITSRNRSGKRVISVPRLSGVFVSRIIQRETWYPSRYSYKDGLRSGTHSLAVGFGINLLREFVIRR